MARWIHKGPDHQLAHAVRPRYGAQTRRRGPRGLRRRRVRKGLAQAGLWAAPLSGLAGIVAAWAAVVAGWPWCLSPRRCWAQPEGSDQRPGDDQRHDVRVGECQRPEAAGDGTQSGSAGSTPSWARTVAATPSSRAALPGAGSVQDHRVPVQGAGQAAHRQRGGQHCLPGDLAVPAGGARQRGGRRVHGHGAFSVRSPVNTVGHQCRSTVLTLSCLGCFTVGIHR
jgi:hypothetical protein